MNVSVASLRAYPFFYTFSRWLWSIYFVVTLALVGFVMGYLVTLPLFLLSGLLRPFGQLSRVLRSVAELVQCLSIRFLLKIQPWLQCQTNFPAILKFYENLGTRQVMFVANHRSNLDTFLLISYIPSLRGLAKSSLFSNIFFAPMMWAVGFIPVQKGSITGFIQGLRLMKEKILSQQQPVLVFPETTRCVKGFVGVQKMSQAVFDVAMETSAVVVPIYIQGTDQLMGRGDLLVHPFTPVSLKLLPSLKAKEYASAALLSEHVRELFLREQSLSCS